MAANESDQSHADVERIARLLAAARQEVQPGGRADELFAALYGELHRMARRELHRGFAP